MYIIKLFYGHKIDSSHTSTRFYTMDSEKYSIEDSERIASQLAIALGTEVPDPSFIMGTANLAIPESLLTRIKTDAVRNTAPLTLEELQQMSGSPVWVEVIDHSVFADKADDFDGWGMVRKSWVRVWDEKRADLVHIDYDFEDYGKTWRAYRMPSRSGQWEMVRLFTTGDGSARIGECSCCKSTERTRNYCPNCGANMKGGSQDA